MSFLTFEKYSKKIGCLIFARENRMQPHDFPLLRTPANVLQGQNLV